MQIQINKVAIFFILAWFLQGCTISKNVIPIEAGKEISKIYVQKNDQVLMEGFHPELLKQLNELGFATQTYTSDLPKEATYFMTYTANWGWDVAMYLSYFRATVSEQSSQAGSSKVLGEAKYDARNGGGNFNKLGHTADKIRPLLEELFAKVRPNKPEVKPD